MNGSIAQQILAAFIPREREKRARKIWLLAGLAAGTLALSFLVFLLLGRLQVLLARPLQAYALLAYVGVFVVTLLSSATILFPAPGIILVLAAAAKWNWAWVALAASVGGALGEITGYLVGRAGKNVVVTEQSFVYQKAEEWMRAHGAWVITLLSGVPLAPFDIVGIVAGGLRYPVRKFLLFCFLGRLPRTFIEVYFAGGLIRWLFHFLFRSHGL